MDFQVFVQRALGFEHLAANVTLVLWRRRVHFAFMLVQARFGLEHFPTVSAIIASHSALGGGIDLLALDL